MGLWRAGDNARPRTNFSLRNAVFTCWSFSRREGGEDNDADYWLKIAESFGGESPVIVVLNQIREHSFDVNRRALRQKNVHR